jgi:rSAM/selenodomain-associated transferase 1
MTTGALGPVTAILVARRPEPGVGKSRLRDGTLDDEAVETVALAMLRCTARRLAQQGRLVLAVTPDGSDDAMREAVGFDVETVGQGDGTLGDRLPRVWRSVGASTPVAFFGMDSPDVPVGHLAAIPGALENAAAAIGPVSDGGYWTIAARRLETSLFEGIPWGTAAVTARTQAAAADAGLSLQSLPPWHDVDDRSDLVSLRGRLAGMAGDDADARCLVRLRSVLDAVFTRTGPWAGDGPI